MSLLAEVPVKFKYSWKKFRILKKKTFLICYVIPGLFMAVPSKNVMFSFENFNEVENWCDFFKFLFFCGIYLLNWFLSKRASLGSFRDRTSARLGSFRRTLGLNRARLRLSRARVRSRRRILIWTPVGVTEVGFTKTGWYPENIQVIQETLNKSDFSNYFLQLSGMIINMCFKLTKKT